MLEVLADSVLIKNTCELTILGHTLGVFMICTLFDDGRKTLKEKDEASTNAVP